MKSLRVTRQTLPLDEIVLRGRLSGTERILLLIQALQLPFELVGFLTLGLDQ